MIKWINASNYWPMLNGGSIIVDGVADIGLKKEYEFQNHEVSIWVNFYCLLKHPMPHSENSDNDFSLDGAIFYKTDGYAYGLILKKKMRGYNNMIDTLCWFFIGFVLCDIPTKTIFKWMSLALFLCIGLPLIIA